MGGPLRAPGLNLPALPHELCDLEHVTSSLFILVSSFVKWKEGCWAESEVGSTGLACRCSTAGTLGRHRQSGAALSPRGLRPRSAPAHQWAWLTGLVGCRAHSTRRCTSLRKRLLTELVLSANVSRTPSTSETSRGEPTPCRVTLKGIIV